MTVQHYRLVYGYLPITPLRNLEYETDIVKGSVTVSLLGQTSGDFSNPDYTSAHPWYLMCGCSASWGSNRRWCRVAYSNFAVCVLAVMLCNRRLVKEVLLEAYRRGRRHRRKWTGEDVEVETVVRLTVREED